MEPNLHRYLITAVSPSQETIQFYVSAANGFEAVSEASGNPNCADLIKIERIEGTPAPRVPRTSWLEGLVTR